MKSVDLKFVKKYRFEILFGLAIAALYFSTRLINLLILPIFADEAIYVRWAQVMKAEQDLRFLPLSDGKTPLFMWVLIPLLKLFEDPLYAGRFLSVLSGFGSLVGIWFLASYLFDRRIAWLSAFFYAIVPYAFFFDRMALVDSFLNFWGIWALFFSVLLVRTIRLDVAMILGMIIAGGVLTKPAGWFFLLALPLSILTISFKKPFLRRLFRLLSLWIISLVFVFLGYNILRLGPNFHLIAARNRDYAFTLAEVFQHPLDPLLPHLRDIWQWFGAYLTWPIFVAAIFGAILVLWQRNLKGILILLWVSIPLLTQAEIAKVFTARYLFFNAAPALIISAIFTSFLFDLTVRKFGRLGKLVLIAALSVLPLVFIATFLVSPEKAPLPPNEREGYLEAWTAGQGLPQIGAYIRERAGSGKQIVVGTEGYFGTLPDGLQIYVEGLSNVRVFGVGLGLDKMPNSLILASRENETYLVANASRKAFEDPRLKLIAQFKKAQGPKGRDSLLFYQVLSR